jgi:hypothetical protein
MEWGDRAKVVAAAEAEERCGERLGYVKVMTDEQMEVLRKQISIYATICEQLVEVHRALTEHQDSIAGRLVLSVPVLFKSIREFWSRALHCRLCGFHLLLVLKGQLVLFMSQLPKKPHGFCFSFFLRNCWWSI